MSGSIRVCHVLNHVGPTSVPVDIALAQQKYTDVEAGVVGWFETEPFEDDDQLSVETVDAPRNGIGLNRQTIHRAQEVFRPYDVVHVHSPHAGSLSKVVARTIGKTIVSTEQNNHQGFTRKGLIANGITNILADVITCVSYSVKDSFYRWENLLNNNIRVVYNGVDLDRLSSTNCDDVDLVSEASVQDNSIIVATAGALIEQKAYDVLIPAIKQANKDFDGTIELIAVGEGELRSELESLAETLDIADKIHLLGRVPRRHVYCLMFECDIYAMPSRWEGFSAAAIEAMASGSACVFSDITEFTEAYSDACELHKVDDVNSLSSSLVKLAQNQELRTDLGRQASETAKEYSLDKIATEYNSIYDEISQSKPGRVS